MSEYPQRDSSQAHNYGQQYNQNEQPPIQQQPLDPRQQAINEFVNYRFSPEELRVIRECETEAFYQRCLPFGFGLGLSAYFGVQKGYLRPNSKYGAVPKVIAFTLFGYIAGRFSYQRKCQEKMMQLPNSKFAEMLRRNLRKKSGNWDPSYDIVPDAGVTTALSLAPFQSNTDSYSDAYSQPSSLNLDTSRPNFDDTYKPTMEGSNDLNEDLNIPTRKNIVTYDELRQKNRDEFSKNQYRSPQPQTPSQLPPQSPPGSNAALGSTYGRPPPDTDSRRANLRTRSDDEFGSGKAPTNKYGDAWSE